MKKFLSTLIVIAAIQILPQTKIIFTAIDYPNDEVRAVICDGDGSNRIELGFNKTYLPVWFNDKILLNSDTFIWQCDTSGENLQKLFPGYRAVVSHNKKTFAFYDRDGIGVADASCKVIKQIAVNTFEDAAITWAKNDDKVSYFDPEKEICYLFNLENDSLEMFGDSIYHPLWNQSNELVLYNRALPNGEFSVFVNSVKSDSKIVISNPQENALVPIWSSGGNKIAYLSFKTEIENSLESDLFPCNLILYDLEKKISTILSTEAGFTDKAFPQMCFDERDEFLYFTIINENNLGSIARVNVKTLKQETISVNMLLDERFPLVKSFK